MIKKIKEVALNQKLMEFLYICIKEPFSSSAMRLLVLWTGAIKINFI